MKRSNCIALALSLGLVVMLGSTASALDIAGVPVTAAYYFNSNTNDSSGNGYNGTVNGGGTATYVAAPAGQTAFSFNGSTNIATTTTDNLGLVGQSFTVDAWVNFAESDGR